MKNTIGFISREETQYSRSSRTKTFPRGAPRNRVPTWPSTSERCGRRKRGSRYPQPRSKSLKHLLSQSRSDLHDPSKHVGINRTRSRVGKRPLATPDVSHLGNLIAYQIFHPRRWILRMIALRHSSEDRWKCSFVIGVLLHGQVLPRQAG